MRTVAGCDTRKGEKMKKLIFVMTILLGFALAATAMAQHGPKGQQVTPSAEKIVAQWSGFYTQNAPGGGGTCTATVCAGELVSCTDGQGIAFTNVVFTLLAGICDDHDPLATAACGGRYTSLGEECSELVPPGVILNGRILHVNSRGKNRICFDNAAAGDCTGATPAGTVIGTGDTRTQTRLDLGGSSFTSHATSESVTRTLVDFIDPIDGIVKRLNTVGKRTISQILAEPNDGANCGGACGLAGTSVRE